MIGLNMPKKAPKSGQVSPKKTALKKTVRRSGAARPRAASAGSASRTRKKPATSKRAAVSDHDIALAAYYIGERRRHLGLPGDERSDWLQAERQLKV